MLGLLCVFLHFVEKTYEQKPNTIPVGYINELGEFFVIPKYMD